MGTGTNPFVIPANTQPLEVALLILRSGAEKIRICCTTDTSTFCDTTGPPFGAYPRSFSTCLPSRLLLPTTSRTSPEVPSAQTHRHARDVLLQPLLQRGSHRAQPEAGRALGPSPAPLPGTSLLSRGEVEMSDAGAAAQTSKLIPNGGIKNPKGKAIKEIWCLSWQPQEAQRVWGTVRETDGPCRSSEQVLTAGTFTLSLIFHFHKGRRG